MGKTFKNKPVSDLRGCDVNDDKLPRKAFGFRRGRAKNNKVFSIVGEDAKVAPRQRQTDNFLE